MDGELTLHGPAPSTSVVRAAGGVVWRAGPAGDVEVLVVHRPRYGDWSFPKGKCDAGEASEPCALREVEEETGYHCVVGPELPSSSYLDSKGRPKQVRYWAMTPASGGFEVNHEVDEIRWLTVAEARPRLSYDRDRDVLAAFAERGDSVTAMPADLAFPPGTPIWADLGTDVAAAKRFYGGLFGWEAREAGPPEETGGYGLFTKGGRLVAGYGPQQQPGPPAWATYIAVADARATAAKVVVAGGEVVVEPMDVMAAGAMASFRDPTGAFFSVWQPGEHRGAELVNEPGSMSWNELSTRELQRAKDFYCEAFGWECVTHDAGRMSYTEVKLGGRPVGGMVDITGKVPDAVPPHWMVYFAVDDCEGSVARAAELGGSLRVGPFDTPAGRFAVVADDHGAHFAVIELAAPHPA